MFLEATGRMSIDAGEDWSMRTRVLMTLNVLSERGWSMAEESAVEEAEPVMVTCAHGATLVMR